ncbi:SH3 domain-containing protein [Candidatus Riflebacteria bacterium]
MKKMNRLLFLLFFFSFFSSFTELISGPLDYLSIDEVSKTGSQRAGSSQKYASNTPRWTIVLYTRVANCWYLNLRDKPGRHGRVIRVMKRGSPLKVLAVASNGWVKVRYKNIIGYCCGDYLKFIFRRVYVKIPGQKQEPIRKIPVPRPAPVPAPLPKPGAGEDRVNVPSPIKYPPGSVNTHHPRFKGWLQTAKKSSPRLQQYFIEGVKNKYGQTVTRDMVIKAVLYNESRGINSKGGKTIQNKWGFTGWMQISKKVAQGLGTNACRWKEPDWNLIAGTKFLGSCFRCTTPPPAKWKNYIPGESRVDRMIKAIVGYNRGPYHKRLKQSWADVVRTTNPRGRDQMAEGVRYGIQTKMALGIELTRLERNWLIAHKPKINNDFDVDKRTQKVFSYVQNM